MATRVRNSFFPKLSATSYSARHMSMESIYEYGPRVGVWRVFNEFKKRRLPLTIFAVVMVLQRHPELSQTFIKLGHEIACHGLRWIHYQDMAEDDDHDQMQQAIAIIQQITGETPLG
jgi:allantoinase